jgi:hypothetical protein
MVVDVCIAETGLRKYIISDMLGEILGESRSTGSFRFALNAIKNSTNENAPNKAVVGTLPRGRFNAPHRRRSP